MEFRDWFPLSRSVDPDRPASLVVSLMIYGAVLLVLRVVSVLLGWIPLFGPILHVIATVAAIYCTIGLLLSLLIFFRAV